MAAAGRGGCRVNGKGQEQLSGVNSGITTQCTHLSKPIKLCLRSGISLTVSYTSIKYKERTPKGFES